MTAKAKQIIETNDASVAVVTKEGKILTEKGSSVRPLFRLYTEHREEMKGAAVADRIVGKAAAAILCDAGVAEVFGFIMSRGAYYMLLQHGVKISYGRLVRVIENRRGDDICPMEKTVAGIEDTAECVQRIAYFIETVPEPK